MRRTFLAFLALTIIAPGFCSAAVAADDFQDENTEKTSVWKESRREYLDKREAHFQKKIDYYNKYKKRIGTSKYRQKAREFYGRQKNIYDDDSYDSQTRYKIIR